MSCSLYRHFDVEGKLLYVGISLSAVARLSQHRNKPWFHCIKVVGIDSYPTREAALAAEKKAIQTEKPLFNKVHAKRGKKMPKERRPLSWRPNHFGPPDRATFYRQILDGDT